MKKNNFHFLINPNKLTIFLFSFIISIPLLLPYFHSGYFPTHDGEWAVVRLADMYRELKDVQIPARYSGNLNFGYGYPLFEFAYPLPYYLGFFIHLFHIGFVSSIKLIFALTVPFSFLGMYLLAKRFWKNHWAGFLCGILYIYYPYRLVDLFVRGSIGESLAFVLFPFIIYFLLCIHEKKKLFDALVVALFIAALIIAHNIMAVEFLPIILLFIFCSIYLEKKERKQLLKYYGMSLLLGFGLSCFFWLPALYEKNFIALSVIPIANKSEYFVQPLQLLLPSWGYGTLNISYQLGIPQIIVLVLLSFVWVSYKNKFKTLPFELLFLLFLGILAVLYILLLFPWSLFFWQRLPLFSDITYPWTLLAPIGFVIAFFAGKLSKSTNTLRLVTVLLIIGAVVYCLPYAHPSTYVNRGDQYYLTNDATTTSSDEYMPVWVQQKPVQRADEKFIAVNSNAVLTNQFSNSKRFTLETNSTHPFTLQINTIYYPGWQIQVDGQPTAIAYNNPKGLMQVKILGGQHVVAGLFTETYWRKAADSISLISMIVLIACIGMSMRKSKNYN